MATVRSEISIFGLLSLGCNKADCVLIEGDSIGSLDVTWPYLTKFFALGSAPDILFLSAAFLQ